MVDSLSPLATALRSDRRLVVDEDAAQDLFWREGWTDGLPIVPPTEGKVMAFLAYSGLEPHQVVGVIAERHAEVAAEKLAINAVMAGCLVEYFPVVVAAWSCLMADEYNLYSAAMSTSGGAPFVVVNGPVAKEIGMRFGSNALGPGNRANATIGRAIRLALINLVGARGDFDRACLGHPGKYTFCIAEEETDSWEPLHVQRGFRRDQSAVSVVHLEGPEHVREGAAATPEQLLRNYIDHVKTWNQGGAGVLIFNAEHRELLEGAGWSKTQVSAFVFEHSGRTIADLKRASRVRGELGPDDESTIVRWARSPQDFLIISAGGQGTFSAVIPPWAGGASTAPVTRAIPEPGCASECFI